MMPFFFGPSNRPLYGVLDPAAGGSRWGVVICQPSAAEYSSAHRSCRLLARRLAEAGVHALRFDPSGTGDSGGELDDVSADDWLRDVEYALDELRSAAGARSVVLIGLRAGCATALAAGLPDPAIEGFVLWDPHAPDEHPVGVPPGLPTWEEAVLNGDDDPRDMLLVVTGEVSSSAAEIEARLRDRGHHVEITLPEERGAWEFGDGIGSIPIPAKSIQEIVSWVRQQT